GANPKSAFVEMGEKFAADERNQEQCRAENEHASYHGGLGMVQTPIEAAGVVVADPVENTVLFFLHAASEPVRGEDRHEGQRKNKCADERKGHGIGHGVKEFSSRAGERVDRKVSGNDDGNRIENGTIDVASGGENDFVKLVLLAVALAQFAI